MNDLMALVPIEAATALSTTTGQGRKSRWERTAVPKEKKSRFGTKEDKPYLPPPFVDLPPGLSPLQMEQFLREQRLDELSLKLEKGELEFGDPDIRPPSPPPAYDRNGNRTNTRDVRVRSAMVSEHQRLLEYVAKNVPGFIPPGDFKPMKKVKKIIIPQEKYPEYNFMGLIIGPRGCNHKRLESESGAQISIRGKGTQKEGKKTDHQTEEEAAMPQHIHIAADTDEQIDKAVGLIEPLLNPFHPMHEEFKKKGLEQLALVNGVQLTKIETRCNICGGTGHLSWECPEQDFQSFKKAEVKCALCGDKGHVTMDCKLAKGLSSEQLAEIEKKAQGITTGGPAHFGGQGGVTRAPFDTATVPNQGIPPPPPMADAQKLDQEFSSFMSQLSGTQTKALPARTETTDETTSTITTQHKRPGLGSASTPPPGTSPPYNRSIPPPPPVRPDSVPSGMYMGGQDPNMMAHYGGMAATYGYPGTPTADQNAMMNSYMNSAAWAAMMGYYGNAAANYGFGYGGFNGASQQYAQMYPGMNYMSQASISTQQPSMTPQAVITSSNSNLSSNSVPLPEEPAPVAPPGKQN